MYTLIEKETPLILVRVRGMYFFSLQNIFFGKQSKSISYAMINQKDDKGVNKDDFLYDFFA